MKNILKTTAAALCIAALSLTSCATSNVAAAYCRQDGKKRPVTTSRSAYIALGRGINDTTWTHSLAFEDTGFLAPIKAISKDSLTIVSEYNGNPMVVRLKTAPKVVILHDGKAQNQNQ